MGKNNTQMSEDRLSDRLIRYIATRSDEQFGALSVSSLAKEFKIDRFKLSRTFKAERNTTLDDFLANEKMYRSAFIILSGENVPTKELARLMGFRSNDYFVRVFRQFFGLSPRQYKEYKTGRSGIEDRRLGPPDRRTNPNGPIPATGERRQGPKDRREGLRERRKLASEGTIGLGLLDDGTLSDHRVNQKG